MEISYTLTNISEIAGQILKQVNSKTLAFQAPMGAGKTTLIKAMLQDLGAADAGNSPTFGIVNEYHDTEGSLLAYHFDFYRLNVETEALDLGLEDYLSKNVWVFMEWPEKIETLLPENSTYIKIEVLDAETRKLHL